jgi:prevent-host-death family protein
MLVSISEAKSKLNSLISIDEATVITKNGDPKAAIVPYEIYIKMVRLQRKIEDEEIIQKAEDYFSGRRKAYSQEELDEALGENDV